MERFNGIIVFVPEPSQTKFMVLNACVL